MPDKNSLSQLSIYFLVGVFFFLMWRKKVNHLSELGAVAYFISIFFLSIERQFFWQHSRRALRRSWRLEKALRMALLLRSWTLINIRIQVFLFSWSEAFVRKYMGKNWLKALLRRVTWNSFKNGYDEQSVFSRSPELSQRGHVKSSIEERWEKIDN